MSSGLRSPDWLLLWGQGQNLFYRLGTLRPKGPEVIWRNGTKLGLGFNLSSRADVLASVLSSTFSERGPESPYDRFYTRCETQHHNLIWSESPIILKRNQTQTQHWQSGDHLETSKSYSVPLAYFSLETSHYYDCYNTDLGEAALASVWTNLLPNPCNTVTMRLEHSDKRSEMIKGQWTQTVSPIGWSGL